MNDDERIANARAEARVIGELLGLVSRKSNALARATRLPTPMTSPADADDEPETATALETATPVTDEMVRSRTRW